MRNLLVLTSFVLSLASNVLIVNGENRNAVDDIFDEYEKKTRAGDIGVITAVMNGYADRLFQNIQKFATSHGLDPIHLDDITESFLGSSINLENGNINGVSTINRYDDVKITYQHDIRKLVMEFPIIFSELNFVYQYHVILLFIGPRGEMIGKINNFKINVQLSFDFNTMTAKIEKLSTMDTGHISLTFHGQALTDLVVNILSEFVTTILHPLLTAIIEGIVKDTAGATVNGINNLIDHLIHPNSTQNSTEFYY